MGRYDSAGFDAGATAVAAGAVKGIHDVLPLLDSEKAEGGVVMILRTDGGIPLQTLLDEARERGSWDSMRHPLAVAPLIAEFENMLSQLRGYMLQMARKMVDAMGKMLDSLLVHVDLFVLPPKGKEPLLAVDSRQHVSGPLANLDLLPFARQCSAFAAVLGLAGPAKDDGLGLAH